MPFESPLTKLSFRRDVRIFLAALVGFLIILIVTLLMLLESFLGQAEVAYVQGWNRTADEIAESLREMPARENLIRQQLETAIDRYDLAAIDFSGRAPLRPITIGAAGDQTYRVSREIDAGRLMISFDASALRDMQRRFGRTAIISVIAAGVGMLLLLLYLPKIVRPIELLLDQARAAGAAPVAPGDETQYLIDTFRSTIETMKRQEGELKLLHERERTRANELERVTATLTRSLTSGFIALDTAGRVVDMNRAAREILGIPAAEEIAGRPIEDILPGTPFAQTLGDAFARRRALSRHELEQPAAGGPVMVGVTTVPLLTEENAFFGMLALFTDVSEVRRLEARLRDVQTLADLGEMSAGIAHEFRNALSTILGYLKLARRQELPPETVGRIRSAEEEANLLAGAVDALLNFARPLPIEKQRIDLSEVVTGIVGRFEEPGVQFDVDAGNVPVDADPLALRSALENLLRNAADSVRQKGGGRVAVRVSADPEPRVVIRDDGVGVNPEDVPRLFLPFQSQKPNGIGLGLPLAKKIVLLHGGTIDMTGAPGEGATVTVTLPGAGS